VSGVTAVSDVRDTSTPELPDTVTDRDEPLAPPEPPRPVPAALQPWHDPHPVVGWLLTAAVTAIAALTRFWALGSPPGLNVEAQHGMNFDEIYYATEAQEMLRFGYEDNRGYLFIVHPPLGKWLIAATEWLFASAHTPQQYLTDSLGWRVAPALFGVLGIAMFTRLVRRVTRSNLFGTVGGLLLTMDGLSLVLARTAILDIFLQTFVIAGFTALVVDRDALRARLAGLIADGADLSAGVPTLGPRPWRLVGAVMLAFACAVKWTGAPFWVLLVVLSLFWDRAALKSAGVRRPSRAWGRRSVLPALGSTLVAPVAAYLLCWLGWFTGENSYDRYWADTHGPSGHIDVFGLFRIPFTWAWVPGPIRSLGDDHYRAYAFHESLDSGHEYASGPWSWLVMGRPVDFYYNGSEKTCGSTYCSREILCIGTPLLWWAFVPMLLWLAWHWFTTRDWRAGAIWMAFAAGWVFWFQDLKRTAFFFYMAPLVPFLVLGVVLALGVMLGPGLRSEPDPARRHVAVRRRVWGVAAVSTYLALVVADFVWMWPLFTGGLLTYDQWHAHMWLPSWV
jgi:dolichyl-phosphate-mannose-protein mannosyltransferase